MRERHSLRPTPSSPYFLSFSLHLDSATWPLLLLWEPASTLTNCLDSYSQKRYPWDTRREEAHSMHVEFRMSVYRVSGATVVGICMLDTSPRTIVFEFPLHDVFWLLENAEQETSFYWHLDAIDYFIVKICGYIYIIDHMSIHGNW